MDTLIVPLDFIKSIKDQLPSISEVNGGCINKSFEYDNE